MNDKFVMVVCLSLGHQYCLIEIDQGVKKFMMPSEEKILAHRVIVATLNTSSFLASLKLEKGELDCIVENIILGRDVRFKKLVSGVLTVCHWIDRIFCLQECLRTSS